MNALRQVDIYPAAQRQDGGIDVVRERYIVLLALIGVFILGAVSCGSAATRMWITDLTGIEKSEIGVAPGSDFDIMVHLNTDLESSMLGVAVAFDRADKTGTAALALDHKLSLRNDSVSSFAWTSNTSGYVLEMPTLQGGLQYGGSGDYAFGVSGVKSAFLGSVGAFTSANSHIATLHLTSNMAVGDSYFVTLWNGPGPENGFTSFLQKTDGSYIQDGMAYSLKVTAVPEPASFVSLLGGIVGVCYTTARRFRRVRRH
jgi:hypothetical protein